MRADNGWTNFASRMSNIAGGDATNLGLAEGQSIVTSWQNYLNGRPVLTDFSAGSAIENMIMQRFNRTGGDKVFNFVVGEWLLASHLIQAENSTGKPEEKRDLLGRAWGITWGNFSGGFPTPFDSENKFLTAWKISVFLRLALAQEDWQKVEQVLSVLREELVTLPGSDLKSLFIASVHTGRAQTYSKLFKTMPVAIFDKTHQASLVDPRVVDYQSLLRLVQKQDLPSEASIPALSIARVSSFKARLKDVTGSNIERVASARAALSSWEVRSGDVLGEHPWQEIGSVVHWLKPGKTNTPLTGFQYENSLVLEGDVVLPSGALRRERWEMKRVALGSPWVGTIEQNTQYPNGETLTLVLETEIALKAQ